MQHFPFMTPGAVVSFSDHEPQNAWQQVALHEEAPSSSGGVRCPICRSTDLAERHGIVLCPAGDLRLDLRREGLTLDHVRCGGVPYSCQAGVCDLLQALWLGIGHKLACMSFACTSLAHAD